VTIYRALAHLLGTSERAVKRLVRVRYTKVAEYQARGAVHFHAVIRVRNVTRDGAELSAEAVAAYVAK
jgi:hypothetical protein